MSHVVGTRVAQAAVFVLALAALTVTNHYYLPSSLVIAGEASRRWEGTLRWDSGDGFNEFEAKRVVLSKRIPLGSATHRLEIRRDGARNPAALDSEVWINRVEIKGEGEPEALSLGSLASEGKVQSSGGRVVLTSDAAAVIFEGVFSSADIHFSKHPYSGHVRVLVDGLENGVFDLYAPEGQSSSLNVNIVDRFEAGPFRESLVLPQGPVRAIRLEGDAPLVLSELLLHNSGGDQPLSAKAIVSGNRIELGELNSGRTVFHPLFLLVHLCLAAALAWVVGVLLEQRRSLHHADWGTTFRWVFCDQKRWAFWLMFSAMSLVYFSWLLGWWPGLMTADSLDSWLQTRSLRFSNWNPFAYAFWLFVLQQVWDSPAFVVIVQLVSSALLGASVFYFLLSNGLRFRWIAPFFLLYVFSIPIAVYNLQIWKDVPFCILTVFWACLLFALSFKRRMGASVTLSLRSIVVLGGVLAFSSMVRHNGVIYLVIVPAFFGAARLAPARRIAQFFTVAMVGYLGVQQGLGRLLDVHANTDYRIISMSVQLNSWAALLGDKGGYYSDNAEQDKDVIRKFIQPDELQEKYNPLSVTRLVYESKNRRGLISDEEVAAIRRLYVKRASENFHTFVAERSYLFFATLGFRNWAYSSNLWERVFPFAESESLASLRDAPKSHRLRAVQARLLASTDRYQGLTSGAFLCWNAFFPLLLVVAAFMLYKWLPTTALACAFILLQVAALFFTIISNDFRYVYFIHLFAYFLVPMAVLEFQLRRSVRSAGEVAEPVTTK